MYIEIKMGGRLVIYELEAFIANYVNKYGSNLSTAEILSAGKLRGMKHTLSMF